jgi:hypothetical protein
MAAKWINPVIWMCGAGAVLVATLSILFMVSRSSLDIFLHDRYYVVSRWQMALAACLAVGIALVLFRIRRHV